MNSKILNGFFILCLIGVIGAMSWRDMHPKVNTGPASPLSILTYYADSDATVAMVPNDSEARWPVTVGVGEFSYTQDGKALWTSRGIKPVLLSQRQVNLQFRFRSLPENPDETIQKISAIADEWVHKGNIVNTFILDYSPAKPDLKTYAVLLKAARHTFKRSYVVYAGINISWADSVRENALDDLRDESPKFLIHLPQPHISPELFAKLQALTYNFILQYPPATRVEDVDMAALKKLSFLNGITLVLDTGRPLPKTEQSISLFPKL